VWAAADPRFLNRVRRTSIVLGAVMAAPFAVYFGLMPAAGWLLGVVWSVVNLVATEAVVRRVLTPERNTAELARGLALKFGLLYAVAIALLALVRVPALWWVAGFTWPLFVAVMKAIGRTYLGLDAIAGLADARRRTP
jgi:hypothetical protein